MDVNYLAVVVAAAGAFAVGWVWYGFLFQKPWVELMGFSKDNMGKMPLTANQAMGLGFVATLLMTYVLAVFVAAAPTPMAAFTLAFWLWLGFVATVQIGSYLWEGKPLKLFLINTSQNLVAMLVATIILVLWR